MCIYVCGLFFFFLMYICLSAEAEGSVADAALAEGVQSNRGRVQ